MLNVFQNTKRCVSLSQQLLLPIFFGCFNILNHFMCWSSTALCTILFNGTELNIYWFYRQRIQQSDKCVCLLVDGSHKLKYMPRIRRSTCKIHWFFYFFCVGSNNSSFFLEYCLRVLKLLRGNEKCGEENKIERFIEIY